MATTGPESILEDIRQGVSRHGSHEIDWLILLNGVFPHSPVNSRPKLREWAEQNGLKFESVERQRGKAREQWLKFSRR